MVRLSPKLLTGYNWFSKIACGVVIAGATLVLCGWATNNDQLMNLWPNMTDKSSIVYVGRVWASAAITLTILSLALLLFHIKQRWATVVAEVLGGMSLAACLAAIYAARTGELVETIEIFKPDPAAIGISYPLPCSQESAITLALISLAVMTIPLTRPKRVTISELLTLTAALIPILIILGAATRATQLCALGGCFKMSTGFAILCMVLLSGIFLSRPDLGLASSYSSGSTGGALLRRATLFVCLVPPLLMARTMAVQSALQVEDSFGWVLFVFVFLVMLGIFIASGVSIFNRVESELSVKLADMRDELERTSLSSKSGRGTPFGQVEMSGAFQIPLKYKRVCLTCTSEYDDTVERCLIDFSPLSRVIDESLIGTTFADKYEVIARLGSGGMSTVYRAKHRYMEKEVAIKVLKGNTAESSDGLKRFQREARATSAVSHPGIVGVSDFGLTPDGRAFLVMDYLEGESLSHMLDAVGKMQVPQVIDIAVQLCDALAAAHAHGIVHRDLKPSNIMLVQGDNGQLQAKIVDFGLAKISSEDHSAALKITQTGDCFGSPLYMSPEQCMGKKVDHRCDIYALGCILFECLTGHPPIVGANAADTITKHVKERPAPFAEALNVPKEIKLIIYKSLHKEPMWRPQNVLEIKDSLAGCLKQL
ncbi:MAG: serine/threonine protein kinase [Candidatus Obscuribacterales bacterium]|nr:serine/threonine protein kinase [Candidatus Obscuribacterales bacterium]